MTHFKQQHSVIVLDIRLLEIKSLRIRLPCCLFTYRDSNYWNPKSEISNHYFLNGIIFYASRTRTKKGPSLCLRCVVRQGQQNTGPFVVVSVCHVLRVRLRDLQDTMELLKTCKEGHRMNLPPPISVSYVPDTPLSYLGTVLLLKGAYLLFWIAWTTVHLLSMSPTSLTYFWNYGLIVSWRQQATVLVNGM